MKLYSYPTTGQKKPAMQQQNMKMPPDFPKQMMQMDRPLTSKPFKTPLAPNSIKKYPDNVPYPYGMKKRYKFMDDDEKAIRQLEKLPKQQYKGGYHYRSMQSSQYLNE
ncbi:hypothetical protein N9X24_00535 [Rickettsiales bacterium]|nr:hypothetical protein [Rickettsiales bacterium]